ncbi:hypothetical protein [Halostagnicola kamekurae]|uniref:Uncharacterized protein n=1 Tax=Halostagnicola kamekurae TaxID=619731 RepID=A0A1I6UTH1_9EURY|nr:hypothetical protein [Halostagnicola kamekurae]SFT04782.1 hypothetical protein SAMN04488556_4088 [Halostagnicola kamekurae]
MGSDAEEFKESLRSFKEFSDGNGGHYLIMQFEDDSGLVFEKQSSDDNLAIAELSPVYRGLMDSMRSIAEGTDFEVNKDRNTQQNLRGLMQE